MLHPVFDDEEVDGLLELGRTQCCVSRCGLLIFITIHGL